MSTPPTDGPCIDCPLRQVCRVSELACPDFRSFVAYGTASTWREDAPRRPAHAIWLELMGEREAT